MYSVHDFPEKKKKKIEQNYCHINASMKQSRNNHTSKSACDLFLSMKTAFTPCNVLIVKKIRPTCFESNPLEIHQRLIVQPACEDLY